MSCPPYSTLDHTQHLPVASGLDFVFAAGGESSSISSTSLLSLSWTNGALLNLPVSSLTGVVFFAGDFFTAAFFGVLLRWCERRDSKIIIIGQPQRSSNAWLLIYVTNKVVIAFAFLFFSWSLIGTLLTTSSFVLLHERMKNVCTKFLCENCVTYRFTITCTCTSTTLTVFSLLVKK